MVDRYETVLKHYQSFFEGHKQELFTWESGPIIAMVSSFQVFRDRCMKQITLITMLFFTMTVQAEITPSLSDIASLEWRNRVVLINETENVDGAQTLLKEQVAEIDDRDIIWFILKNDRVLSNYPGQLTQEFLSNTRERLGAAQEKVILIGKDGEIKSQSGHLDLEAIFSEIDAMPMRQYEMQN